MQDNKTVKVNIRVITATNVNLEEAVRNGRFREDLFYRLNIFPIAIPPLKDRGSDILLLADYFVKKYADRHSKQVRRVSTPAIDMLMAYHWPGNVRELENVIERAVILSDDDVIHGFHLPPTLQTGQASGTSYGGTLKHRLESVEKEMLTEALKEARGNMAQAAKSLGITERMMGLRVRKYGINYMKFRRE